MTTPVAMNFTFVLGNAVVAVVCTFGAVLLISPLVGRRDLAALLLALACLHGLAGGLFFYEVFAVGFASLSNEPASALRIQPLLDAAKVIPILAFALVARKGVRRDQHADRALHHN